MIAGKIFSAFLGENRFVVYVVRVECLTDWLALLVMEENILQWIKIPFDDFNENLNGDKL